MTECLVILYCNGNALEAVEGLANLVFLKDFRCQDNNILDLSMLPTERLQTFRAENNRLRISDLARAFERCRTGNLCLVVLASAGLERGRRGSRGGD